MARILVIDDSYSVRITLDYCLRAAGHDIILAEDGPEGLRLAAEKDVDLVLADVNMPGMNGVAVCRALKGHPDLQSLPVLLMTGSPSREAVGQAAAAGAGEVLRKPFVIADLVGTLGRYLAADNSAV